MVVVVVVVVDAVANRGVEASVSSLAVVYSV